MLTKLHRFRTPALAVMALAVLLAAPAVHAMKLKSQNLTQLISQSQSIVQGTVRSVTDGIDANGVPYTEITLAVGSSAKGGIKEGSDYTFRQFGLLKPRSMGNGMLYVALTPEGFPRWREGETVVAFLRKPASRTGLQTTVGVAQGKLTQINGRLANDFDNAGLFDNVEIDSRLLNDEQRNMMLQGGPVDAGAFVSLVGKAVSENWIEKGEMK